MSNFIFNITHNFRMCRAFPCLSTYPLVYLARYSLITGFAYCARKRGNLIPNHTSCSKHKSRFNFVKDIRLAEKAVSDEYTSIISIRLDNFVFLKLLRIKCGSYFLPENGEISCELAFKATVQDFDGH